MVRSSRYSHRIRHPVSELGLLRRADFLGALVAALAAGAGVLSLTSLTPALVERGLGGTALVG